MDENDLDYMSPEERDYLHRREIEYEWAYKDAPVSKSGECIAMDISASQSRFGHTTMTLSLSGYSTPNPIRHMWRATDYVDRTKPFTLVAEFDRSWPLKLGFWRLGELLDVLDYERIPAEEWQDIVVRLPKEPLPYDAKSPSPIRQNAFTNIGRLQWTGHRRQLRESWIPFTASILQSINTLDITCDLSLQDCTYILFHSTSLKELKIEKIDRELAYEPALWFDGSGSRVERSSLESLALTSDDNIGPLFESFNFPSLHHVELELKYPTLGTFDSLDIWANIRTGFLDTFMTVEDGDWIRKQLPVGSQFKFKYRPGIYGELRRYLNREATEWITLHHEF